MKKEELNRLRHWCVGASILVNVLSITKKMAPESVEIIHEQPADKSVHVYEGIEKIAAALKLPIHFVAKNTFLEKRVTYDGVIFFSNHKVFDYLEVMR